MSEVPLYRNPEESNDPTESFSKDGRAVAAADPKDHGAQEDQVARRHRLFRV